MSNGKIVCFVQEQVSHGIHDLLLDTYSLIDRLIFLFLSRERERERERVLEIY